MKKMFAFAAMFAAVAMVACGGEQPKQAEEALEVATEAAVEAVEAATEAAAEAVEAATEAAK
jgi:uncharacterized lipoprotein YmbA